jgi:hypothetical protein
LASPLMYLPFSLKLLQSVLYEGLIPYLPVTCPRCWGQVHLASFESDPLWF